VFGKHPLDVKPAPMISDERICDALRLAIIAEVDAITFYRQMARASTDKVVAEVFKEVAEEEKEHLGEFMYLLRRCDGSLDEMMKHGEEEVKELINRVNSDKKLPAIGL
jgi:rubrerythrin